MENKQVVNDEFPVKVNLNLAQGAWDMFEFVAGNRGETLEVAMSNVIGNSVMIEKYKNDGVELYCKVGDTYEVIKFL